MRTSYHVVGDYEHAIAKAVNAGVDVTMEPYDANTFVTDLRAAVNDHLVSRSRIRQAVTRVLTMKFRLGLFDHPYVNAATADRVLGADTALARTAAAESSVLLRNQGSVLPLSSSAKVVVTGPAADSVPDTLGGWSVGWQGVPAGSAETAVTVRAGLQAAGGSNVTYAASQAAAVDAAKSADAVVMVAGRGPGAEGPNDQRDPTLPADQQAEVDALQATGKPVIVVLIDDRPDVLGSAANADAVLAAWRPGSQGGNGVADLLYGKVDPSGKLSVSWPKLATDQPSDYLYNTMPTTYNGNGSVYQPAYPFGFGLSYAPTSAAVTSVSHSGHTVSVAVKVTNTGSRGGDVVVPVYASQPQSAVLVPAKRLAGFTRVTLTAGQSRTVHVSVPTSALDVVQGDVDASGPPTLEHGHLRVLDRHRVGRGHRHRRRLDRPLTARPSRIRESCGCPTTTTLPDSSGGAAGQPGVPGHGRGVGQLRDLVDDDAQPAGVVRGGAPRRHQSRGPAPPARRRAGPRRARRATGAGRPAARPRPGGPSRSARRPP